MRSPRAAALTWGVLLMVAVAVRVHNVIVFPELRAPDGFGKSDRTGRKLAARHRDMDDDRRRAGRA